MPAKTTAEETCAVVLVVRVGAGVGAVVWDGAEVGAGSGALLGTEVGSLLGVIVGTLVGVAVGVRDGALVGNVVGVNVGTGVGDAVGTKVHMPTEQNNPERQSASTAHVSPTAHCGHSPPPQSTSVSEAS